MNRNTHAIIIGLITFCWMCSTSVSLYAQNDKEFVINFLRKNGHIEKDVPIQVGNTYLYAESPIGKDDVICWGTIEEMQVFKKNQPNEDWLLDSEICENYGIQTIGQWIKLKSNPIPQKSSFVPGGTRSMKSLRDDATRLLTNVENVFVKDSIESALNDTKDKNDSISQIILAKAIDLGEASINSIYAPYRAEKHINGEKRLALVIGNNNYSSPFEKLTTPGYDARSIAVLLRDSLGFDVVLVHNAKLNRLREHVRRFREQLSNEYSIGLFYYAGHGFSDNQKDDFIVSVDGDSISYNDVIADLQANKKLLIFFDACRNIVETKTPLKDSYIKQSDQTMIMTSVRSGNKADDGVNNSPFEKVFVKHIYSKNVTVLKVLETIKKELSGNPSLFQWSSENSSYMLYPDSANSDGNHYWGVEATISSPFSLSGGLGALYGRYMAKEGLGKNIFGEIGSTINYLNPDELYLYNSPNALASSESFKYNYRWDIFARIGYEGLKLGSLGIDPYLELSEQNFFSKHPANALALSGNIRFKLPFWNAYIAGGLGIATSLGDNWELVLHKAPYKNRYWNVQVGINFHK